MVKCSKLECLKGGWKSRKKYCKYRQTLLGRVFCFCFVCLFGRVPHDIYIYICNASCLVQAAELGFQPRASVSLPPREAYRTARRVSPLGRPALPAQLLRLPLRLLHLLPALRLTRTQRTVKVEASTTCEKENKFQKRKEEKKRRIDMDSGRAVELPEQSYARELVGRARNT